jgi:hypothetical protein
MLLPAEAIELKNRLKLTLHNFVQLTIFAKRIGITYERQLCKWP